MSMVLSMHTGSEPTVCIDLRDIRDPLDRMRDIQRVLDTRKRDRRRRKGMPASGPTSKRAKIKAARKANVRRMRS